MKAYVLDSISDIKIKDIETPKCLPGEVLVEVKAAGICGSDIPRIYKTGTYHFPLIPGHEFSGEVVKAYDDDSEWKNKRVGIFPLIPCMKCAQCHSKKYEMCRDYSYLGSRTDGGFAEYVRVPTWNLINLPDTVSYEQAAMLEPMSVAVHAARNAGLISYNKNNSGININKKIAIMGLGTIGLSLVMMLLSEGYTNIFAIGNKEIQKKIVKSLGLKDDCYIDSGDYTAGEDLVDVFFDCAGTETVMDIALNSVVPGGKVICVGNPASDMNIPKKTYWNILRKQLNLIGTWNSSFTHDINDDWHYVIDKLKNGEINPEKMITHSYDLDGLINGFEIMREKKEEYVKVMMVR